MQQLILNIDESRYLVLLKFLKTLDYVRIVQPGQPQEAALPPHQGQNPVSNQLALLKQALQCQTKPLFQQIADPAGWQKLQRDEWGVTC